MAHRKLQQEIDRVFKKINEGLEIFNSYHERHESSTNSSQKDKLENDLKREIKKLQKLREQIKVWQTSNDVKDKEKLLEYRRLVEIAMEKYKVVEKGSKIKAYSNTSLKASSELDPEEKEKLETIDFIQDSIDDLERQFQIVEVDLDKLNAKKSKKSSSNDSKKEELKEIQSRYRWHQQNLELTLRLLENGELQTSDIQEIKEDLEYFLQNNRDPNFIDNEYIYESLDLDANEVIQHEVVTSLNGVHEVKEASPTPEPSPSKPDVNPVTTTTTTTSATTSATTVTSVTNNENGNPSKTQQIEHPSIQPKLESINHVSTPVKTKKFVSLNTSSSSLSNTPTPLTSQPGTPTVLGLSSSINNFNSHNNDNGGNNNNNNLMNTLKPATQPKPSNEIKWSSLVAGNISNSTDTTIATSTTSTTTVQPSSSHISKSETIVIPEQKQPQVQTEAVKQVNGQSNASGVIEDESPTSITNVDDSNYLKDSKLIDLPPGIQDIILSSYSTRVNNSNNKSPTISNVSQYLSIPRYYLKTGQISQQFINSKDLYNLNDPSLEFQRCFNTWNNVRNILLNDLTDDELKYVDWLNFTVLGDLDIGTLFYGYYFSLSPLESQIISNELKRRRWKVDKLNRNWYQKIDLQDIQSYNKEKNQLFEDSNYKKFDSISWSLNELKNYQLDLTLLD